MKGSDRKANTVTPDQSDHSGAVYSWFKLFPGAYQFEIKSVPRTMNYQDSTLQVNNSMI